MKHKHPIAFYEVCICGKLMPYDALKALLYMLYMFGLWVVYVMDLNLYIYKYVLEEVMYLKLDLKCLKLEFEVENYVFSNQDL